MSQFAKLVPGIVKSSVWDLPSDIRIVWITMLALKDKDGYVQGAAKALARQANVSEEATEEALRLFQEPDPSSHTPDNEGRRIAPAPGGWIVLNHMIYRAGDHRADHAEYMRKWRESKGVKNCESQVHHPSVSVSVSESVSGMGGGPGEGDAVYLTLRTCPDLASVTHEQYIHCCRCHPQARPEIAVKRTIDDALARSHGLDDPGAFLKSRFSIVETEYQRRQNPWKKPRPKGRED